LERLARNKHPSLLRTFVNYELFNIVPSLPRHRFYYVLIEFDGTIISTIYRKAPYQYIDR
jgi:hypothetical protein